MFSPSKINHFPLEDLTGVAISPTPRGGSGKPDAYSPCKEPDGRVLMLAKSSKSKTGYANAVVEQ